MDMNFGMRAEKRELLGRVAAMVRDEERCIRCALCVKRCPYDAITMVIQMRMTPTPTTDNPAPSPNDPGRKRKRTR